MLNINYLNSFLLQFLEIIQSKFRYCFLTHVKYTIFILYSRVLISYILSNLQLIFKKTFKFII